MSTSKTVETASPGSPPPVLSTSSREESIAPTSAPASPLPPAQSSKDNKFQTHDAPSAVLQPEPNLISSTDASKATSDAPPISPVPGGTEYVYPRSAPMVPTVHGSDKPTVAPGKTETDLGGMYRSLSCSGRVCS